MVKLSVKRMILGIDIYGRPIKWHFKGNDSHKTQVGGIVTLCAYTVILVYLSVLISAYFDGSKQDQSTSTDKFDFSAQTDEIFNMQEWQAELSLITYTQQDARIGEFKLYEVGPDCYERYDDTELRECLDKGIVAEIEQVPCSEDYFQRIYDYYLPRISQDLLDIFSQSLICFDLNKANIQGKAGLANSKVLNLRLMPCSWLNEGDQECASDEEIAQYFKEMEVIVNTSEKRIDFYDVDQPVKQVFQTIEIGVGKKDTLYVQEITPSEFYDDNSKIGVFDKNTEPFRYLEFGYLGVFETDQSGKIPRLGVEL